MIYSKPCHQRGSLVRTQGPYILNGCQPFRLDCQLPLKQLRERGSDFNVKPRVETLSCSLPPLHDAPHSHTHTHLTEVYWGQGLREDEAMTKRDTIRHLSPGGGRDDARQPLARCITQWPQLAGGLPLVPPQPGKRGPGGGGV